MRKPCTAGLVYSGERDSDGFAIVRVNGSVLSHKQATTLYPGGPDGFDWGYNGSGPSLLAVGLLYDYLDDAYLALRCREPFCREVVSKFVQKDGWSLPGEQIDAFVRDYSDNEYHHLLNKARDAKHGGRDAWVVMSTGEKAAVALVLNRPEWLAEFGYTIPEALDRSGVFWVSLMPRVARELAGEDV